MQSNQNHVPIKIRKAISMLTLSSLLSTLPTPTYSNPNTRNQDNFQSSQTDSTRIPDVEILFYDSWGGWGLQRYGDIFVKNNNPAQIGVLKYPYVLREKGFLGINGSKTKLLQLYLVKPNLDQIKVEFPDTYSNRLIPYSGSELPRITELPRQSLSELEQEVLAATPRDTLQKTGRFPTKEIALGTGIATLAYLIVKAFKKSEGEGLTGSRRGGPGIQ